MKRLSLMLLAPLVFTGCHAPMPSFNLLAPYGSTRIPPPATGSVGPDTYYQPSSQSSSSAVGTGFRARQASTSLSTNTSSDASTIRKVSGSDESGQVTRATHEATTVVPTTLVPSRTIVESRGPVQIVEARAPRSLPSNIRGMRINEAVDEPAEFFPTVQVIDIAQLPPATSGQFDNVVPINQAIGSSAVRASTNSQLSSRSSAGGGNGWQPRN